jgi:hypothetical protein
MKDELKKIQKYENE